MITSTSFKSIAIRAKIMGAMRRAKVRRQKQVIFNRYGSAFLTVQRVPGSVIRCFRFISLADGTDVTETVYKGLRS